MKIKMKKIITAINNPNLNEKLKQENSDTVAWLKVENTNIEIPVVQAKDNSYYLTHNFNKKYNVAGWVFADYKNKFEYC